MRRDRTTIIHLAILIALCAVQFFAFLGHSALWDIDEGMHAVMAKNMVLTGDWITPVFNGEPFFDKPALFNWLGALSFGLFGFTEFAARAPAALAGLGCVVLTYLIGRRAYGPTAGLLAGVVLATSLEFAIISRVVQYDIPFTFFTTLALYVFCVSLIGEDKHRHHFLWFYVATGLAILTKGPLGLFLPSMVIALYIVQQRRWSLLSEMRIPAGIAVLFVVVAPWYLLVERANPGYLEYFFLRQHLATFLGEASTYVGRHPEPWYFYLPYLVVGLFPWSFLLPQSVVSGLQKARGPERAFTIVFVIWAGAMLLFFSAASSKLATYILPMFPAAALLIGRYGQRWLDAPLREARLGTIAGLGCAVLLFVGLGMYVLTANPWPALELKYGVEAVELNSIILAICVLLAAALLAALRSRRASVLFALTAVTPLFVGFLVWFVVPDILPYRSAKDIGLAYDGLLDPGEKMVFHGQMLDSALFYTGREAIVLPSENALQEFLSTDEVAFAIVRSRTPDPATGLQGKFHVIEVIGNKAIISNRPRSDARAASTRAR